MKGNAIARIILFSIAILVLGGILVGGMLLYTFAADTDWSEISHFTSSFMGTNDGTVASVGEVSADEINNIEIDWTSGSVLIQTGNVDTITFAETPGLDENQKMLWSVQGDTLKINCSKFRVVIGITTSKDLVVTVPIDWACNDLEITAVSADITVDSLIADDVTVSAVDGKCDFVDGCDFAELNIETVSGDITYMGNLKKLECEGVDAAFHGSFTSAPSCLNLSSIDGNIELILPEDVGFIAALNTVSGSFTSNFHTSNYNNRYTYGNGDCAINLDSVSGNLTISKAE